MRDTIVGTVGLLIVGVYACGGKPLTGPEAQEAFSKATSRFATVPGDAIVYLDGVRLEAGAPLAQIDQTTIERIEVVKGAAAVILYGEEGRTGVIRIYTRAARE